MMRIIDLTWTPIAMTSQNGLGRIKSVAIDPGSRQNGVRKYDKRQEWDGLPESQGAQVLHSEICLAGNLVH
jgi:hypothetical protein